MEIANPITWQGTDVDVTGLEGKIARLWTELLHDSPNVHAVRTHVFNLVAYTEDAGQAREILDGLNDLSQSHPSRSIVIAAQRLNRGDSIDAEVSVQCGMPSGDHPTCCHEQILLTVRGRPADHLVSVISPLLLPDIPTYLWWPGQPLFGHRTFHRLVEVSDRLVIDSARFNAPGDGLASLSRLCTGRRGVNDINWARLTPWREIIAQFFDGVRLRPYVQHIQGITLKFGAGDGASRQATASLLLTLGWVGSRLGWEAETTLDAQLDQDLTLVVRQQGRLIPIDVGLEDRGGDAVGRLTRLEIVARPENCPRARFEVIRSDDMQQVNIGTLVEGEQEVRRVVPLAISGDVELLADELEVTGRDDLYDIVVREAGRMAGREV